MRLRSLLQSVSLAYVDLDDTLPEHVEHIFASRSALSSVVVIIEQGGSCVLERHFLREDAEIDAADGRICIAVINNQPAPSCTIERRFPGSHTNTVEDYLDAASIGQQTYLLGNILLAIKDDMVGPGFTRQRSFFSVLTVPIT